ncbi:protein-glutamine gamma-glutamyltransferase K-like [Dreissena polymorpha]|nr:protein-glutamine gamma-glutamyltransferase K-like [Dreissena polymorpha]
MAIKKVTALTWRRESYWTSTCSNPSGCVYRGNAWTRGAKEWNFGQFEEDILQAALFLMRKGFKEDNSRAMADPVKVSRVLVKMVNSQDDNGVLVGNWSGNYADGTAPTAWVGSVKILRQYMSTGKPVQYGQCWVFSCVTTTLCRALGIPCRTVTNFASAHDTDGSNCIEKYFRLNGNALEKADVSWSGDSVWNFHVWNEVWLSRPDLEPRGHYDGWQVIDATPQETSEGVYTCGPCPLVALKAGECGVKFDTGFVFAEVNADEVHWELLPGGGTRRLKVDKKSIGKFISTKIPDGKPYKLSEAPPRYDLQPLSEIRRLDITDLYKYPEGSEEERKAVLRAHQTANHPVPGTYETESVVEHMEYHLRHSQEVLIGDNLPLEFTATNTGSAEREIMLASIRVAPKAYTGETGRIFFEKKFSGEKIASGKTVSFKTVLTVADYLPNLMELAGLYIEATATVKQLGNEPPQSRIKTHDFRFRRPDLDVKGPQDGKARLGEPMQFVVSFTNPLPQALINCDISMESDAFEDIKDEHVPDVPAKAVFEKTFKLIPTRLKQHAVIFSFDCKTLKDIAGSATVTIEK